MIGLFIPCYNNFPVSEQTIISLATSVVPHYCGVVFAREGKSVSQALNIAIFENPVDTCLVLGADDWLESGGIAAMAKALDEHPECEIAYGNYIETRSQTGNLSDSDITITPEWTVENMRRTNFCSYHIMFRRSLWDRIGGYDETMLTCEDWEFAARAMARGAKAVKVEAVTFWHFNHRDSKMWKYLNAWGIDAIRKMMAERVPEVFCEKLGDSEPGI